jgi:hypothetical protein
MVSLVGYTNAGKSTLFTGLSREAVLCEDKLFATLDPVTRRVKLPVGNATAGQSGANETEWIAGDADEGLNTATTTTPPASSSSSSISRSDVEASPSTAGSGPPDALTAPPPLPPSSLPGAQGGVLKHRDVFLTDTVGFISKLPANLIASFR